MKPSSVHAFGYGGTRTLGDKSLNRRVEIKLIKDEAGVARSIQEARALWSTITNTYLHVPLYKEVAEDPEFLGDPGVSVPIASYRPN